MSTTITRQTTILNRVPTPIEIRVLCIILSTYRLLEELMVLLNLLDRQISPIALSIGG